MIITKSEPLKKEELFLKNKKILGALALDLKRVAMGYFRESNDMADNFLREALKRRSEIDDKSLKPYLVKFLKDVENLDKEKSDRTAEDALLYSIVFQNAAVS